MDIQKEQRSSTFQIRMRPTVKALGEKAAAAESRSLSALMEVLLIDHLRAKGYLPPGGPDAASDEPSPAKPAGKPKR